MQITPALAALSFQGMSELHCPKPRPSPCLPGAQPASFRPLPIVTINQLSCNSIPCYYPLASTPLLQKSWKRHFRSFRRVQLSSAVAIPPCKLPQRQLFYIALANFDGMNSFISLANTPTQPLVWMHPPQGPGPSTRSGIMVCLRPAVQSSNPRCPPGQSAGGTGARVLSSVSVVRNITCPRTQGTSNKLTTSHMHGRSLKTVLG